MDRGRMMKDEKQETTEEPHMAESQGQVNQRRSVLCGDLGPNDRVQFEPERLIVGASDSIPFFPSFIDNLAPKYWALIEGGSASINFFPSSVDDLAPHYWALPSDQELEMTSPEDPALHTPESSGQGVDDLKLEDLSEKLSLLYKSLVINPESAAADVSSSSRAKVVTCTPGANGDAGRDDNEVQFQHRPVSSAAGTSTEVHHRAPHESRIPSSRVVQGEQVELAQEDKENDATSGFQNTRPLELYDELEAPPIAHVQMQSGVVLLGDLGSDNQPECKREGLIEGRCDSIPFFQSFHDNLGPRYRAELSEQQGATVPKLGDVTVTPDNAALITRSDSSRIGILQDLILDNSERDELTSIHKPLTTCSESAVGDRLINVPFTVRRKGVIPCTQPAEVDASGKDNTFQLEWTPVSSTGSITPQKASRQLQKPSSRNFKSSRAKNLEDDWDHRPSSTRLGFKRVRPSMVSAAQLLEPVTLQPQQISRGPSYTSDDFEDVMRTVYAVKPKRPERRRKRTRMRISPYVSFSRRKMLKTFSQWHSRLGLENPACSNVASHIFFQGYRMFQRSSWPPQMLETNDRRLELLMATAFWVAAKILETNRNVPTAERVARIANISAQSLVHFELVLLDALRWQLVRSR